MTKLTDKIMKLPAPGYSIIFLPLFYALSVVYFAITKSRYELSSFTNRYIGVATLENFNVSARVSQFYLGVLVFIVVFLILFVLITRLVERKIIASNELLILNLTSFCGLVFLYTRLFGPEIYSGLRMLMVIHGVLYIWMGIRNIFLKKPEINIHLFVWIILISFCFLFATKKISSLVGFYPDFSFTLFMGFTSVILLILLRKQMTSGEQDRSQVPLMRLLEPLVWLPLLSVLSDELYMILNQRGIFNISPLSVFAVLFLGVTILTLLRANRQGPVQPDSERLLSHRYFPILVAGLSAFAFYTPVQNASGEMFETANVVLPVQQYFEFGKIPVLDTFSSHLLSDSLLLFIYAILNGYKNLCFSCYDFILGVASSIIVYYAARKLTGNGYFAFFIALFYPYAEHLIPSYLNFALVPLLILTAADGKKNTAGYALLFFVMVFLAVWRMDLGFPSAFATVAAGLLMASGFKETFNRKAFFKAFFWVAGVLALFAIFLLLIKGKAILHNIQSGLDYFSSAQSYGSRYLNSGNDGIYYLLYYFFPVLVLAALGYALYKFFTSGDSKVRMLCVVVGYLSVFYFLNFQRGLVRHGLQELWDVPVTSFAFLIFMTWALLFLEKKNQQYSFVVVTALMTLMISRYKFPEEELKKAWLYSNVYEHMKHFSVIEPSKTKINRMQAGADSESGNYSELKKFLDKNSTQSETFADFSNTPMLYYYLHRKSPHFISQSPVSYHSEKLQGTWIKEVEQAHAKVVLFSSYPETWFDITDGVPNTLRHYIIAEYLFTHYHPGYILNDKSVWLSNEVAVYQNKMDTVYSATAIDAYSIEDGIKNNNVFVTGNNSPTLFVQGISIETRKEKKYFFVMDAENLIQSEEKIYFYYNGSTMPGNETKWKYASGGNTVFGMIPVSADNKITGIRVTLAKNSQFNPHSLNIIECDYVPDYYSTALHDFNLNQLAYLWGNLDLQFKNSKHKVLREVSGGPQTIANYSERKFLFEPMEHREASYIVIRASRKSDDKTDIILNYGEGNKKSGGFTFNLPVKETVNYVIRVSTQYNWYHKANSWITIYPMGSDIEIEKIQITTAD